MRFPSMKPRKLKAVIVVLSFAFVALPFVVAHGAGGRIEGRVTDPKGAVVVGAVITVTDATTNRTFSTTANDRGEYKVEGLPPGLYIVTVSAKGFTDAHRADVTVDEGATTKIDVSLEIAPVEATVTVTAPTIKPNSDPTYQQLRQQAKTADEFSGPFATVNNLILKRDAAIFTLKSGEIYFAP